MLLSLAGCINGATGQTFISAQLLAQRIGIDPGIARGHLKRLQDSGIVINERKQVGRADTRSITLPCNHLDIDAGSPADTYAESPAEIPAEIPADTSLHYQDRKRTEQEQQQRDPVVGHSQTEKEKFRSKINSELPKHKQVGFTKQFQHLIDLTADPVQVGVIIRQLHIEQNSWKGSGGTISALDRITQTQAATYKERQPKPVLNPCAGLDADTECDNTFHTTIGDVPVQPCPQKRGTN